MRQNFPRTPRSSRLCAGLSGFYGQQGPQQTCPKADGWDPSQGVPELLHSDRVVWGCGALRSAWWGPTFVLGGAACSLIPVPVRTFPKNHALAVFGQASCVRAVPPLPCPSPGCPVPSCSYFCAQLTVLQSSLLCTDNYSNCSLRRGAITPF